MRIKLIPIPKGTTMAAITSARVACAQGEHDDGRKQVSAFVSAFDVFDLPYVVANLHMSPAEARELGEQLIKAAGAP